jgi:septal ring factor EnvC (AmiA/AmiB activator)
MNREDLDYFAKRFERLEQLLFEINNKENQIMAQIDDLNTQIANVTAAVNQLGTDLAASIADLEAKIAASGTTIDLTKQIAALTDIATTLTTLDAADKSL